MRYTRMLLLSLLVAVLAVPAQAQGTPDAQVRAEETKFAVIPPSAARAAYDFAVTCLAKGKAPQRKYEDLVWLTTPDSISIPLDNGAVFKTRAYFDPHTNTIWVMEAWAKHQWVLAHEALHAIGVIGHGSEFKRCRLTD